MATPTEQRKDTDSQAGSTGGVALTARCVQLLCSRRALIIWLLYFAAALSRFACCFPSRKDTSLVHGPCERSPPATRLQNNHRAQTFCGKSPPGVPVLSQLSSRLDNQTNNDDMKIQLEAPTNTFRLLTCYFTDNGTKTKYASASEYLQPYSSWSWSRLCILLPMALLPESKNFRVIDRYIGLPSSVPLSQPNNVRRTTDRTMMTANAIQYVFPV